MQRYWSLMLTLASYKLAKKPIFLIYICFRKSSLITYTNYYNFHVLIYDNNTGWKYHLQIVPVMFKGIIYNLFRSLNNKRLQDVKQESGRTILSTIISERRFFKFKPIRFSCWGYKTAEYYCGKYDGSCIGNICGR